MTDQPIFSYKGINLKQPYCFIKVSKNVKFREIVRDTIVLINYQIN